MKVLYRRLISLNLALIMVLLLLPVGAAAASGRYVYHNVRPNGAWTTYSSANLDLNYTPYCYGYTMVGWSLEKDGLPVADASQVPEAKGRDVELYSVWGHCISVKGADDGYSSYICGPVMIGDTYIRSGKGEGWSYSKGELRLTQDYPGYPIVASGDLLIRTSGHVTIIGSNGPAVSSVKGTVHIAAMEGSGDKLTLIGRGDSAVWGKKAVVVESPANVELIAPEGTPVSRSGILYDSARYAGHKVLLNRICAGGNQNSAGAVDTINVYDISETGKERNPYPSYVRFEAVSQSEMEFSLVLDPGEGQLPGSGQGESGQITVSGEKVDLTAYDQAGIMLENLPDPSRSGYAFTGWDPSGEGEGCYGNGDVLQTSKPRTVLHALWQKAPGGEYVIFNGNGKTLKGEAFEIAETDVKPLENGKIILPDNEDPNFAGWHTQKITLSGLDDVGYTEGVFYPGQTVSLNSGTTIYALYHPEKTAFVHGNGYRTAGGNDSVLVLESCLQASSGTLMVYSGAADMMEVFRPQGKVLLDFNTKPDGSGRYTGAAFEDVYAQWADAPKGSVLLYSDTYAASAGRYGKVLSPGEAANFDPQGTYGFEWAGHDLEGWYSGQEKVSGKLPEPNADGYIILRGKWTPRTITYAGTGVVDRAKDDGTLSVMEGTAAEGKTFNGWNSEPDGSGTWYLPGERCELRRSFTVYPQYLDTPDGGSWILAPSGDGKGIYQMLKTVPTGVGDKVSVTMPESETGWGFEIGADWNSNRFGYYGGAAYEVSPGMILGRMEGLFHANGGTFLNGTQLRSAVCSGTSWSSLQLYPSLHDFETVPEGMIFKGWSTQRNADGNAEAYQPGEQIMTPDAGPYYAVWEDPYAVTVIFSDVREDGDYSRQITNRAGRTITVPDAERAGYTLDGWGDGLRLWLPGETYTIPDGGTVLTAQWSLAEPGLPVPYEMLQVNNCRILLALYDSDGRCIEIRNVESGVTKISVEREFDTCRFFCIADDGSFRALTPSVRG